VRMYNFNKFQKQGRDYSRIMLLDRFCIPRVGTCAFVSYVFTNRKKLSHSFVTLTLTWGDLWYLCYYFHIPVAAVQ